MDDVGRDEEERSRRDDLLSVAEGERELPLDHEEPVGMVVMDVRLRATLTGAVGELRHDELVGLDEHSRTTPGPLGDPLTLRASRPSNDDEPGIAGGVLRNELQVEGGSHCATLLLVLRGVQPSHVVPESGARDVQVEEMRALFTRHHDRVHDVGRYEDPGVAADPVLAILETELELALHDVEGLGVGAVHVCRWHVPAVRPGANIRNGDLLELGEQHDVELAVTRDPLAFDDLDHDSAA